MTVAAKPATISYIEDGVSVSFAVPYRFKAASDLVVERLIGGAVTALQLGTDYSVTGGKTDAGGTLTRTAATNGATLRITRDTARAQVMTYATGDRFPAASHEDALDRQMLVAQEQDARQQDTQARALMVPAGEVTPDLAPLSARIGGKKKIIGVDQLTGTIAVQEIDDAYRGAPGGDANSYADLGALKEAEPDALTYNLRTANGPVPYAFVSQDFSGAQYAADFASGAKVKLNAVPLNQGALVRLSSDSVTYRAAAIARTLGNEIWLGAEGVSPLKSAAENTAIINRVLMAAAQNAATIRLTPERIEHGDLVLPDAACSLLIRGSGRPKSYSGGVNGDQFNDPSSTLVYVGTNDAFHWALSGVSKRVYLSLENMSIEGNPNAKSGIHLFAPGENIAFLASYNRVSVRKFPEHNIWHDGNVFESRLDDVRSNYSGGAGFKASFNAGGIPGETTISGGYFSYNDRGIDLSGGGKWSLTGVSSSYNTTNNLRGFGVQIDCTGLQTEGGNFTAIAADSVLVDSCTSSRFIATSQAVRDGSTGNGMRFVNCLSPFVCGHKSNSAAAGAGYKDIRFDDSTTRGSVMDVWPNDFVMRVDLGKGGGNSFVNGNRPYTASGRSYARSTAAVVAPNVLDAEVFFYTAMTDTLTINNPIVSNTPVFDDGKCIDMVILNNSGGPITINWGGLYARDASLITPPVNGKRRSVRFIYDASANFWMQVGAASVDY